MFSVGTIISLDCITLHWADVLSRLAVLHISYNKLPYITHGFGTPCVKAPFRASRWCCNKGSL